MCSPVRSRRTMAKSKTGSMPEETPASSEVVPVGAWVSSTALRIPCAAIFSCTGVRAGA